MTAIVSQNVIDIDSDNNDNSVVTGQDPKVVTIFPTKNEESTVSDRDSHARLSRQGGFPGKQESYII